MAKMKSNESAQKEENYSVYIIESPSDIDHYNKRYEGELLKKALELAGILSEHKVVVNLKFFIKSLSTGLIEYVSLPNTLPPLLHM